MNCQTGNGNDRTLMNCQILLIVIEGKGTMTEYQGAKSNSLNLFDDVLVTVLLLKKYRKRSELTYEMIQCQYEFNAISVMA